jgi:hypothetical protein
MPLKFTGCTEEKGPACFLEVRSNLRCCWSHFKTPHFMRSNLRCCWSHFKTPHFITEKLQAVNYQDGVYGPLEWELADNFDLQEEWFCRNALKRLGAYNEDDDDEMYLLAMAEDGNAIAQLEMADMCSPLHSTSTHLPSHLVVHCRAVTARGA